MDSGRCCELIYIANRVTLDLWHMMCFFAFSCEIIDIDFLSSSLFGRVKKQYNYTESVRFVRTEKFKWKSIKVLLNRQ